MDYQFLNCFSFRIKTLLFSWYAHCLQLLVQTLFLVRSSKIPKKGNFGHATFIKEQNVKEIFAKNVSDMLNVKDCVFRSTNKLLKILEIPR